MGVLGTENRAYDHSDDVIVAESSSTQHHFVQIDDYDSTDAINMMNNSYEYYSKLNIYGDATTSAALRDTEEALESIMMNNSYCLDVSEEDLKAVVKNSTSTISIDSDSLQEDSYYGKGSSKNTYEEYNSKENNDGCKSSYEEFCSRDYDEKPVIIEVEEEQTSSGKGKIRTSSQCSTSSCSEIVADTNLGRIYYNCKRIDPRLPLNIFDTSLTGPVPNESEDSCCSCTCQSSSSDIVIGCSDIIKEKALVEPVKSYEADISMDCCRCSYEKFENKILTRSVTEQSLKSTTDDLPSYRSLIAFRLQDCPPNYESVTGIKVNVDEIRKELTTYTRQRLRREVRTCSDLNSSAKRLLVLMAAIIIAICIVMIVLTI